MSNFLHTTVLLNELVDGLNLQQGQIAIDCTAGGGGHTAKMLEKCGNGGLVIAFDRDQMAIDNLHIRFQKELAAGSLKIFKTPFSKIKDVIESENLVGKISAIAADIGVSSPQIDLAHRGFSFMNDGPLDMRMDPTSGNLSAQDVVNTYTEDELSKIFWQLGEEPKAKFVAKAIIKRREVRLFSTTQDLADVVKDSIFYKEKSKKHPATKVFQALRIYVNQELEELDTLLKSGFGMLHTKGRFGIISFHSLEDRIVKQTFKGFCDNGLSHLPRGIPLTTSQMNQMSSKKAEIIKPFPIIPSDQEMELNPRARSAKLRLIEKL